ncbi:hypothetical protein [Microbacterium laevaniformans]|uniref:hypothetical protein n=1 Tax=Microbacterium laevaniformans TaxID=36807 RepID=UPI0036302376
MRAHLAHRHAFFGGPEGLRLITDEALPRLAPAARHGARPAADDEAKDVAALATWHGWDAVARIVPPETARRARIIAATYPLQLLCFAIAGCRPAEEIERALTRANDAYTG